MIEDICRFVTVVNSQSITKAAQVLHITQPAVSLSIKRLEKATNTQLFIRSGKQFIITEDGKSLYQIGQRILELWERAKDPHFRSSSAQLITVGLFDNAALQLAPFFQKKLSDKSIQIDIKIDNSLMLLQELQFGILDICICVIDRKTLFPKNSLLVKDFLEELIPVSSEKNYTVPIEKIPFILYKKGSTTRNAIDEIFFIHKVQPTILAESTSTSFMKELAMRGSGMTLLPKNFIEHELEEKVLFTHKMPFRFFRKTGIFIRKDSKTSLADTFMKQLTENLVNTHDHLFHA